MKAGSKIVVIGPNADIVVASIGFHRTFEYEGEDRTYQLP